MPGVLRRALEALYERLGVLAALVRIPARPTRVLCVSDVPPRIAAGRPRKRARSGDGRHSLAGDLDIAACADTEVVRWCDTQGGRGGIGLSPSDMVVAGRGVEGLKLTPARLSR